METLVMRRFLYIFVGCVKKMTICVLTTVQLTTLYSWYTMYPLSIAMFSTIYFGCYLGHSTSINVMSAWRQWYKLHLSWHESDKLWNKSFLLFACAPEHKWENGTWESNILIEEWYSVRQNASSKTFVTFGHQNDNWT